MFSSAATGKMNAVSVFRWLPLTGEQKYGGWFLRIRECRPTKIWPFPPHSLLPTLDIVATIKTDISRPEI